MDDKPFDFEDDDEPVSEMDRFTDDGLTVIFNDPEAGGVLREALEPVLSRPSNNAVRDGGRAAKLCRRLFPADTDTLFFDEDFLYAFVCNCRNQRELRNAVCGKVRDPMELMMTPALECRRFDYAAKRWLDAPDPAWTRSADAVGWRGVLPARSGRMVAVRTSPVWARLVAEPYRFIRSGSRWLTISHLGRGELRDACAAAGAPDMNEDVMRTARRMKKRNRGGAS